MDIPWSIGTITQFPVFLSIILSILTFFPNIMVNRARQLSDMVLKFAKETLQIITAFRMCQHNNFMIMLKNVSPPS